ncbi:hypothetical protein KUCAC02_027193, partial [Chaenocephalus aceratus]
GNTPGPPTKDGLTACLGEEQLRGPPYGFFFEVRHQPEHFDDVGFVGFLVEQKSKDDMQEVEGAASHGVFCGMPLPAPSPSHEMGKHEIKVEKTYKGVEGG